MTQKRLILDYMKSGKPITSMIALQIFNCFSLAQRIKNLRDDGHRIITKTVNAGNKRYAKYQLEEKMFCEKKGRFSATFPMGFDRQ